MTTGIEWWVNVFLIITLCFSHAHGMDKMKKKTTVNMAEVTSFMTEKFRELVKQTNVKFTRKFSIQEVLHLIQENINEGSYLPEEIKFIGLLEKSELVEENKRLLKNVEKLTIQEENNAKNGFPFAKLHINDWYKLMEFLGVRQMVSPLVRANSKIYQTIQSVIQNFLNEKTEIFLAKFLQLPMEPGMIKIMSQYCKEHPTSNHIFSTNFLLLWNKLERESELSLLTKPLALNDDQVLVELRTVDLFGNVQNKHTYYDYAKHKFINVDKDLYIPGLPMFYHFLFPSYDLNAWFRIDHAQQFKKDNNFSHYSIEFCGHDNVIISVQKRKTFNNDNAWRILYKKRDRVEYKEVDVEISNTMALFMEKIE